MRRALIGLIAGLAVTGVVAAAAPSAHAESHFSFYFGAGPVVVAPPIGYNYVWQTGYYPYYSYYPYYYGWNGYNRYWNPYHRYWNGYNRYGAPGQWGRRVPYASWNGYGGYRGRWDRARWDQGRWRGDIHHGNGRWAADRGRRH